MSHSAGSAAETAQIRKESKYSSLPPDYIFQPVVIETLGPLNSSALNFLSEVGCRLTFFYTIRYDTRCYFNVRSKADISQA